MSSGAGLPASAEVQDPVKLMGTWPLFSARVQGPAGELLTATYAALPGLGALLLRGQALDAGGGARARPTSL